MKPPIDLAPAKRLDYAVWVLFLFTMLVYLGLAAWVVALLLEDR